MRQENGSFADSGAVHRFPCARCGSSLNYSPGVSSLVCSHCGHAQEVPSLKGEMVELDFDAWLEKAEADGRMQEVTVAACAGCGASIEPERGMVAMTCPFCGLAMDLQGTSRRQIKPTGLLPFKVEAKQARDHFRTWVSSRWFAPNRLKRAAREETPLSGLYVPYWTFDARTESDYRGQRGVHYQVQETYTVMEGGRSVQKTRTVTRTRWSPAHGHVSHGFDDVLVMASDQLPGEMADKLEPWDLEHLVAYDPGYVGGFRAQSYQLGLADGFTHAKGKMVQAIEEMVRRQIGGDVQRIDHLDTRYDDITFKHVLLPLWLSTYRFGQKSYRFLINGRTGEVQGERPYSRVKITFAVLAVLALLGGLWLVFGESMVETLPDPQT
ncbi:MAG: primosomal protein N' (replication factor Y) - superfamily II helicase [Magnetococcales bacterium]|nr:primosomal protein N' (replication factor Y) - superfamily II helicase [Magnetococcales bacterium]MBF0149421.1 primosomal protein N' (replication factor Y) - superfamily II helicase [Magnetococcales bacterium]